MTNASYDRRVAPRRRCFRPARCVLGDGILVFDVVVKNVSDTGVRIEGEEMHWLPDRFEIDLGERSGNYSRRHVRRIWVHERAAGLQFSEDTAAA